MYLSQTKKKNGLNIVDGEQRFFVTWEALEKLKKGEYKTNDKPIIVLSPLPAQ